MQGSRQSRLALLVRRNKGRVEYPYYATELSHLLEIEINQSDVLELEETDRLSSTHLAEAAQSNKEAGFAFKKTWKYKPLDLWSNFCRNLGKELFGEPAVLFVGPYEFCGGLKVNAETALSHAASLLEFDKDTVCLHSVTTDSGLYLDLYEEHSEWFVELVVWGQWKELALARGLFQEENDDEHR